MEGALIKKKNLPGVSRAYLRGHLSKKKALPGGVFEGDCFHSGGDNTRKYGKWVSRYSKGPNVMDCYFETWNVTFDTFDTLLYKPC